MSRLVDPTLCPDCRATLDQGRCPTCGLVLRGPLADELWQTMVRADGLVERLRATPSDGPMTAGLPAAPVTPAQPAPLAPAAVPSRAVPALLLALGGLLVFVAVSLFLAVTWSILPLGVKAVLMVGFTAALAAGGYAAARRGLRGSSEAAWGLAGAVLALDLAAAHRADLFGLEAVDDRTMTLVSGVLLAAFGAGAALLTATTRIRSSVSAEVVAAVGLLAVCLSVFWSGPIAEGPGQVVGSVLLAAIALLVRGRLRLVAAAATGLAVLTWLDLVAQGALRHVGERAAYWQSGIWWTLLVAAALAAGATLVPGLQRELRVVTAGAGLAALGVLGLQPWLADTVGVLQACGVLVVLTLVTAARVDVVSTAARGWAALGGSVAGVVLAVTPVVATVDLVARVGVGGGRADSPLPVWDDVASWTWFVVLLATTAAAVVCSPRPWLRPLVELLPAAVLVTAAGVLGGAGAPAWSVVLALGAASVLALVGGVRAGSRWVLAAGAPALVGAAMATVASGLAEATAGGFTVVAVATLLLAALVAEQPRTRTTTEIAGGLVGAAALLAAAPDAELLALVLTVLGTAVALSSVLRTDRAELGWVAGAVLAAGTVVRVAADVRLPEVYALPAAALLLTVGTVRLTRDPQLATWRMLGAGLSLALLPSLLLALPDPGSLRTVLVGVGGAAAVAVGLQRRWQAPFLIGGGVLVVLALRFLLPVAGELLSNPLGAWLLFGAAGGACLLAGVLWEQSLRNLRSASRYVGSLR